ncbi:MAG: hypothetical protein FWG75_05935 [Cystobacterineae bacterium]|nr:hypothetical protein [Cystobacterineae bacterium]
MSEKSTTPNFSTLLLHPWPGLAAMLILFNAFYLRLHHAGFWSGKLSDVGICFLLPVLLAASWMLVSKIIHSIRPQQKLPQPAHVALVSCLIAAAYFSALNLLPGFPHFHQSMMGFWVERPIHPTMDVTDLFCLAFTVAAYVFIRQKLEGGVQTQK